MCVSVCVSVRVCMRVCMHFAPLHFVSTSQIENEQFREFEKKMGYGQTNGWMDGWTDRSNRPRDEWTDQRMDRPSYSDARTHLKR